MFKQKRIYDKLHGKCNIQFCLRSLLPVIPFTYIVYAMHIEYVVIITPTTSLHIIHEPVIAKTELQRFAKNVGKSCFCIRDAKFIFCYRVLVIGVVKKESEVFQW